MNPVIRKHSGNVSNGEKEISLYPKEEPRINMFVKFYTKFRVYSGIGKRHIPFDFFAGIYGIITYGLLSSIILYFGVNIPFSIFGYLDVKYLRSQQYENWFATSLNPMLKGTADDVKKLINKNGG